jgi:hypothetical protein
LHCWSTRWIFGDSVYAETDPNVANNTCGAILFAADNEHRRIDGTGVIATIR